MKLKSRRISVILTAIISTIIWLIVNPASYEEIFTPTENTGAEAAIDYPTDPTSIPDPNTPLATDLLNELEVKGRAPKTGYSRDQFYISWPTIDGCNLRQKIIKREFGDTAVLNGCDVVAGEYDEPYTGKHLTFTTRSQISSDIQIDHVVALSDAWQKGAQNLTADSRYQLATDPLNLLAVDTTANFKKSDGDAATWLPPNKKFRCQYVARQVSVKYKYHLWITEAEKTAISNLLANCPSEPAKL